MQKNYINKSYILLLVAPSLYFFGDTLFDFFIAWSIVESTGNVFNAAYVIGGSMLFRAIIALVIGIFIDKYNKKHLIIISTVLSIVVISIFGIFYSYAISHATIALLFVFINDINNEIFSRSMLTLSAEILGSDVFIKYQSQKTIIVRMILVFGSSMAAFLISFLSHYAIFSIKGIVFMAAGLCVLALHYTPKKTQKSHSNLNVIKDVAFTINYIKARPNLISFITIMFFLNLVYGFIPHLYPVILSTKQNDVLLMGLIKTTIVIGEIIGLSIVTIFAKKVSKLFKIAMVGNILAMSVIAFDARALVLCGFFLYGLFDSLTQPLFSFMVSSIDNDVRGRIIGGIDSIILISPSIGIWIGTMLMNINSFWGYAFIVLIFSIALIFFAKNRYLSNIDLNYRKECETLE